MTFSLIKIYIKVIKLNAKNAIIGIFLSGQSANSPGRGLALHESKQFLYLENHLSSGFTKFVKRQLLSMSLLSTACWTLCTAKTSFLHWETAGKHLCKLNLITEHINFRSSGRAPDLYTKSLRFNPLMHQIFFLSSTWPFWYTFFFTILATFQVPRFFTAQMTHLYFFNPFSNL